MRKNLRKICSFVLIIALVAVCMVTLVACQYNPKTEVQEFTVDGDLKVGIISDSQLPQTPEEDNGVFKNNLINALKGLKKRGVNMIIFAGDIGNEASNYAYDTYNQCFDLVFGNDKPIVQTILGNHDYWGGNDGMWNKKSYQSKFEEKLGQSPFTHYKVNGYHFIGASPTSGSMDNGYSDLTDWIDEQIAIAVEDDPNKPVFVITHNSPKDTVYGSDDWGDKKLYDVFAKYEQVVNISGHLHYSMMDERSIHQQDFTAFSTQSVSYTELEEGKENGTIPPKSDITPMGQVMEFSPNKVTIKRINFGKDLENGGFEEKADKRWELPIPLKKSDFKYSNQIKQEANQAPTMVSGNGNYRVDGNKTYISFNAGSDDDFVHSYKLVWSNGSESLYFSDFINGLSQMAKQVELQIFNMPKGKYDVKIYAVDSYGKVSSNFVEIKGVEIKEKIKYN